jgi:hypothetical protein
MIKEKQLLQLKEDVNSAKIQLSKLKGKHELYLQQLYDKFKCKNINQAEKLLKEMEKEQNNLQKQIDVSIEKLKTNYNIEDYE